MHDPVDVRLVDPIDVAPVVTRPGGAMLLVVVVTLLGVGVLLLAALQALERLLHPDLNG